jgi:tetratricopeptide (TPR) repeat protein
MTDSTLARLKQAVKLQLNGKLAEAEKIYLGILDTEPDQPDANHLLGLIRGEQDLDDEAVTLIEKAISQHETAAPFHHNIAGIYRRLGRLDDAEREFRRAIELKADYGEAYQGLGEMVKFSAGDPIERQIQDQLASKQLDERVRSYFNFAAGKFYDDVGDYDRAFEHYLAGNREAHRNFDTAGFRQQTKDTIYAYGSDCVRMHAGAGVDSRKPIFVVGMPRSGTTLVEQILSSHSGVFGAGELNDMKFIARGTTTLSEVKQPYPNSIAGMPRSGYARLGTEYLNRLKRLTPGEEYARVVDKHPLNFQFVGLIMHLFPNAKIIHSTRHPLDTCLSCFFQNFTKGQDYSFDLIKLAHFYNDYRRMMEHWQMMFPGRIHNVAYESVLEDQERETRRLLDFCDLEFEQGCIAFHETDRSIKTASFMQVRRPIYQSSKNRWRNYERQLAEVARTIGVQVVRPVTISRVSGDGRLSCR